MRRIRLLPMAASVVLTVSCINPNLHGPELSGKGEVCLELRTDQSTAVKASADEIPVDAFRVEIYNSSSVRLYRKNFSEAKDETISLNTGDYRLLAKYGDTLGVGFDKPFYMADLGFIVHPQTKETIEAVATLANVKVAVAYGDNLKSSFQDFYAIVGNTSEDVKSTLKFTKDETRCGYIPGGGLQVELYADMDGNGTWKYYVAPVINCNPRDFVTFKFETDVQSGTLSVNIFVDDSTEQIDKTIEIPAEAAKTPAPAVESSTFGTDGKFAIVDGDNVDDNLFISINSPSSLASCTMEITSDKLDLSTLGIPQSVDLMGGNIALSSTPAKMGKGDISGAIEAAGIWWGGNATNMAIDFSGFAKILSSKGLYSGANEECAVVKVTAVDINGLTTAKSVSIDIVGPTATLSVAQGDVWAWKVEKASVEMGQYGDPEKVSVEYSADGSSWAKLGISVDGRTITTEPVKGLSPATNYSFRAMYDGRQLLDETSTRTEEAEQVGNAGFEDWHSVSWTKATLYEPFADSQQQWWDVNSKKSMPSSLTIGYRSFKCMPTVTYSNNNVHGGKASAQVATINIGNTNSLWGTTGSWYVGELFIGKADDNGDKASEGHEFNSRPSEISFWYQFEAYSGSDCFSADVSVKDAAGKVIASASLADGPVSSSWQKMTMRLSYTDKTSKASSLNMAFKSSASGSHECDTNGKFIEIAGNTGSGDNDRVKLSSLLRIDDIELIYGE